MEASTPDPLTSFKPEDPDELINKFLSGEVEELTEEQAAWLDTRLGGRHEHPWF